MRTLTQVRALVKEARDLGLVTYRQKGEWVKDKISAHPRETLVIAQACCRLDWPFSLPVIERLALAHINEEKLASAFDRVATISSIRGLSIERYCREILGIGTDQNGKAKCPIDQEQRGKAFIIDEQSGKWTCFGKFNSGGDLLDLHARMFGFTDRVAALNDLLARTEGWNRSYSRADILLSPINARPQEPVADEELIRQTKPLPVRKGYSYQVDLLRYYSPGQLPIVGRNLYEPIIGTRVARVVEKHRERLQYLCCSAGKREDGGRRKPNLGERIWLCCEWDDRSTSEQLRLLNHLRRRGWPLVCAVESGHRSIHGLFLVKGKGEETICAMRALALRLGASKRSLEAWALVRWPNGTNSKYGKEQTCIYANQNGIGRGELI
jgi:hypothetical protein